MAKILVVDDSHTQNKLLSWELEKAGHKVVQANNGREGFDRVNEHKDIQLILSDVNMPDVDGLTMVELIRGTEHGKKIPVIMLTTETTPDMKNRGREVGANAWITKPFNAESLLVVVDTLLKRAAA